MKLFKTLTVDGKNYPIVSETVKITLDRPGVAVFQVLADAPLEGKVNFSMGWNYTDTLTLFFTGEVERSITVDAKQQRLLCRELSARIDDAAPVALRHPTLKEVLEEYAKKTELSFILPEKLYASTKIPAFYGFGSAFHAMQNIGAVFHIHDYVWLTQGDGKIFVGSWEDSRWKGKTIEIPQDFFTNCRADGTRTITALPSLRPGCDLAGQRVSAVTFSGHQMEVACLQS